MKRSREREKDEGTEGCGCRAGSKEETIQKMLAGNNRKATESTKEGRRRGPGTKKEMEKKLMNEGRRERNEDTMKEKTRRGRERGKAFTHEILNGERHYRKIDR